MADSEDSQMKISGRALVMGDSVNTDILHPSQFFSLDDRRIRAGFLQAASGYEQIGQADLSNKIVLAGDNFGCGSSRETGARVFLLAGIRAIVARSLASIFKRNILNLGLPAFECPGLESFPEQNAEILVDVVDCSITIPSLTTKYPLTPLDPYWQAIIGAGGLIPFLGLDGEA